MSTITQTFSKSSQNDLLSKLKTFRDVSREDFDSPLKAFLSDAASSMKKIYLGILDLLIAGEYYFGSRRDLKRLGSSMIIWRIPVGI